MQTVNRNQGIVSKFLLEHILLDCANLHEVRQKYFTALSLQDILDNANNKTNTDFIKDSHFYHQQ